MVLVEKMRRVHARTLEKSLALGFYTRLASVKRVVKYDIGEKCIVENVVFTIFFQNLFYPLLGDSFSSVFNWWIREYGKQAEIGNGLTAFWTLQENSSLGDVVLGIVAEGILPVWGMLPNIELQTLKTYSLLCLKSKWALPRSPYCTAQKMTSMYEIS